MSQTLLPFLFLSLAQPSGSIDQQHFSLESQKEIEAALEEFHQSPRDYLFALPPKWDAQGNPLSVEESRFPKHLLKDNRFIGRKIRYENTHRRDWPKNTRRQPRAPIPPEEHPKNFVDQYEVSNLFQIRERSLEKAEIKTDAWSDSYWPIAKGMIANRYADPGYPASFDWKENSDYLVKNLGQGPIEKRSPAEKYDLLVGDTNHSMTRMMLEEGAHYYNSTGSVEIWMGICHGWAPAAFRLDRPQKAITLKARRTGEDILFYPADIKALATLLWSKGLYVTQGIGQRCNNQSPKTDENGRITDPECFDSNPGAWHLAVVNQMGVSKRSFVMDATYDYQVWNQPVLRYQYTYFNPITRKAVATIEEARVRPEDFKDDKFKSYRTQGARWIVGIAMDLVYLLESTPTDRLTDNPEHDEFRKVRYMYDLELAENGNILGGEWYTNLHPDFLWKPHPLSSARAYGDYELDQTDPGTRWSGEGPIPERWANAIRRSTLRAQPLERIVKTMIENSRAP